MIGSPPPLHRSTDGTPTAVQHTHALLHARLRRLARDHEAEINDWGLAMVRRAAFAAYIDSRTPIVTSPIAEVLG